MCFLTYYTTTHYPQWVVKQLDFIYPWVYTIYRGWQIQGQEGARFKIPVTCLSPLRDNLKHYMESQKFINKKTGEVATQIPIMELGDYREYYGTCFNCGTEIDKQGRCGYKG